MTALAGPLDDCFQLDERERYRCAYRVARSSDYPPVIARVQAEVARHPDHSWGLHTLGSLLTDQGRYAPGISYFERAASGFDAHDDVLGRVYSRLNLGAHLDHLGRHDDSRQAYEEAAHIATENDRSDLKHAAQLSLARNLLNRGERRGDAWELAHQVEAEVFPDGNYQTKLLALHVLYRVAMHGRRTEELLLLLDRKEALAREENDTYVLSGVLLDRAETLVAAHHAGIPIPDVPQRVLATVAALESMPNAYMNAQIHCAVSRLHRSGPDAVNAAQRCVDAFEKLDDPADVRAAYAQLAHASGSTQAWQHAKSMATSPQMRAEFDIERLEMLALHDLEALESAVQTAREAAPLVDGTSTWRAFEVAAHALAPTHPELALELAAMVRGAAPNVQLSLTQLQQRLRDRTLVVYLLPSGTQVGSALVVSAEDVRTVSLDVSGVEGRLDAWTGLIRGRDDLAAEERVLYTKLIEPLGLLTERVVIAPSGPLHALPFDALRDPDGTPFGASHSVTLARRLDLVTVPRIGVEQAVVLADPPTDLAPLPRAVAEAASVASVLNAPTWIGARATATALTEDADWIHLAAHVTNDDRFPERTAVHLADGRLTADQVRGRVWNAPVVVLSACQSAGGRVLTDGPLGMARAFTDGGASTVIGTLWPLRDDDAERFFTQMYGFLADGRTLEQAVVATKRSLAAEGHPEEAWAGVVLIGEGGHRLERRSRWWMSTLFGGALALLALYWSRR